MNPTTSTLLAILFLLRTFVQGRAEAQAFDQDYESRIGVPDLQGAGDHDTPLAERLLDGVNGTEQGSGEVDDLYDDDYDEIDDADAFWQACDIVMTDLLADNGVLEDSYYSLYDQVDTQFSECYYSGNKSCSIDVAAVNQTTYRTLTNECVDTGGVTIVAHCRVRESADGATAPLQNATYCLPSPEISRVCTPTYYEYFVEKKKLRCRHVELFRGSQLQYPSCPQCNSTVGK
jgi:hypothetical protein